MRDPLATLKTATDDSLFPSETDAPLVPFHWPSEETTLTLKLVAKLAGAPADAPIETQTLAGFFADVIAEEDWMNEDERAGAKKFQHLVKVLRDTLEEPQVFRIGETKIDIYIVGRVKDGFAGVQTQVVET